MKLSVYQTTLSIRKRVYIIWLNIIIKQPVYTCSCLHLKHPKNDINIECGPEDVNTGSSLPAD